MIHLLLLSIENSDDREFLEHIYLSYKRLMFSEIMKKVDDRWATEDILHSVVIKLIDKLQLLRTLSESQIISYVVTTSRNAALNHLRSIKKKAEIPYNDAIEGLSQDTPGIDERILYDELLRNIGSAWEKLNMRNKRVLELKYILEKPNDEIARELGIGIDSVRMVLTRARNSLKALSDSQSE